MTHALITIDAPVWDTLRTMSGGSWIWLDMAGTGLHSGQELPAQVPAQLSHVWGWGPGWWVRARADIDLPGGIAGVRLVERPAGSAQPGRSVTASPPLTIETFSSDTSVGRTADNVTLPQGLQARHVRLSELNAAGTGLWQTTIIFVDAGDSTRIPAP